MQTDLVEALTVVDHVPALQYEHWAPEVAENVPNKHNDQIYTFLKTFDDYIFHHERILG